MVKILLSNDDGVYAQGLAVLSKALEEIGHVTVVAPDRNRSGASNSLTLSSPLRIKRLDNGMVSVEGTPTDCVHLAITAGILEELPNMVVAGINAGANLGDDVWYSGTVAAAMEGRFLGLPAVAVSLCGDHEHYQTAAIVARCIIRHILLNPLPSKTILNVNVPNVLYENIREYEITRLGTRHRAEPTVQQLDPRGQPIYWVGPAGSQQDAGKGTDFHAVANNCVSITPLRVDMTDYDAVDHLSQWAQGLNGASSLDSQG